LGYFYERQKHFPIKIQSCNVICCAAPPEGGRSELSSRFTRHFHVLCMPETNEDTMLSIFKQIVEGWLHDFKQEQLQLILPLVLSTITIYDKISSELLPTPLRSHYLFNLRDVSKVFQGIL
jgi:dynein heavy chain